MADRIIRALSKEIADKIAAGEVVERPLSVVKELVENSIDAGATSVVVESKAGGKDYIRVTDNGCGIERIQLPLAFKRYATSKIATEQDLNAIETLGFRGEALASVASVAKVKLISKTEASFVGSSIQVDPDGKEYIEDAACEQGTTIVVEDLFFNIPARKKFLKADNVEGSLIIDFVSKAAIAYPKVAFRLVSNGTILFSTNGRGDLLNAIQIVYGPEISRHLVPVAFDNGSMKITGYVSSPTSSKNNKKWETFFVNGRLIKSRLLESALATAYHDKLFENHYPIAFLFLEVDPTSLDVNIHPHKTEIRFYKEDELTEFIVKSVRKALLNPEALNIKAEVKKPVTPAAKPVTLKTPTDLPIPRPVVDFNQAKPKDNVTIPPSPVTIKAATPVSKMIDETEEDIFESLRAIEPVTKAEEPKDIFKELRTEVVAETEVQEEVFEYNKTSKFTFSGLTYVGQAFNTYLICKDEDNIYFIDQHAAHERVMYEKLLAGFNKQENASQPLLTPIVIDLSISQKIEESECLGMLKSIGFEIEEFGPASFIAKAVPAYMELSEAENFLNEFFNAAAENKNNVQARRDSIISRSCKSAVKAHDKLADTEVFALFREMDKCENPFSCPHGRPTFLKFSSYEVERMFKRK
ncbi:MAG: DNA mismatch repair endonuclease MutL [Clostridia bacterium]|nr:DNA mismatch repair endonuclease MutL [Clostridia bacterium]